MTPAIPISEALADQHLLGAALGDVSSWQTWRAVLKAAFAEALTNDERALFARVAGGRALPSRRVRELWCGPIGRRSGKSRVAAAIAVHIALLTDHNKRLAPGEIGTVAVIAASREQASTVFNYVRGFLQASPLLAGQVESIGRDEIWLRGDICIAVVTNSFRVARGMTLLAVIGDEVSYWRSEDSATPDLETYRAVLPSLVASGGMWIGISTGYRRAGLLFQKHREHFGHAGDDVLVVSGATETFNPTIDPALIAKARAQDPEAAEAEWDGGFRRDIAAFLSDRDIDAAVDHDRPLELRPRPDLTYTAFTDPSGGRHDAYCIAIGHFEGTQADGRFVCDLVRGAQAPFDPQTTTRAFAALLQEYGLSEVVGDAYAAEWVEASFRDAGITYVRSEKPKSALYLEAQTLFARGAISLPDHPILLRELRLLERRTHRSGRDTVDHGWRGHDDHANAVLGCAAHAMRGGYNTNLDWIFGPDTDVPPVDPAAVAGIRFKSEWQRTQFRNYILSAGGTRPWWSY
jgi:hypothetical protein